MRVHEFVDEGLGHSSYLVEVGDRALIVDPPRFPVDHEGVALRHGLDVIWTADTHSHADYVTGSPALAARTGATFLAPRASAHVAPHQPLADGDVVDLGDGHRLVALATPGHTPDHMAYLIERDGAPAALFSGGSLMVGAVGRTDLLGPEQAEPLARQLYHTLHDRLLKLPDDLAVFPTHGAGSFCSAPGGTARITTIGAERATNPLLAIDDEDDFVARLLAGFGSFPSYFARLPELNRCGPRPYDRPPELSRLDLDGFDAAVAAGALVVDTRPIGAFAAGHVPGSLSDALRPVFASWLGWLVGADRPLAFVLDSHQSRSELVRQCLDVGHERLLGELDGGIDTWRGAGRQVEAVPLVAPGSLPATILDVRQLAEYTSGHVPGVLHVELGTLPEHPIPTEPLGVMCGHGERAMTAASILTARGHPAVSVLDGGPGTWAAATGVPLESGA